MSNNMNLQNISEFDLALKDCREAANEGYAIAKNNLNETAQAIKSVETTLSNSLKFIDNGSVRTPDVVDQLKSQLAGVVSELKSLQQLSAYDLEARKKHLDHFSITLFGRTMAGKSTLMEILTCGDGTTIGTGSQRTTRDVRTYTWNGLKVTDVPGVAAFKGSEDEEIAFKSATQADLVLFLITDDAPQNVEAECFAKIIRLGKPVLGICNVKVSLGEEDDLILFLRNPDKPFDRTRIGQILAQFNSLSDKYIPGKRMPFVVAHLHSKYLAQHSKYAKYSGKLVKASRFSIIESKIIQEVTGRGTFLRMKSFIDGSVVPMMELTEQLLNFSEQNSRRGRVLIEKKRQLQNWSNEFKILGTKRLHTLISKLMDKLRAEVPEFSENYYDSHSAGEIWNKLIDSIGIKNEIEKMQKILLNECKNEFKEIARELESELSLVADLSSGRLIKMDSIIDTKKAWNWGTNILAGGLTLAAVILGSGPLGGAAVIVGTVGWLFSLLFDDREKKTSRAREKLSQRLYKNIDKIERKLRKNTGDWFHQELLNKQVYVLLHDFGALIAGLFELADTQRNLAWTLNDRQKILGRTLVDKVLNQLDSAYLAKQIVDVVRVPGVATMLLIIPNTTFPNELRTKIQNLLEEPLWFVIDTGNQFSILLQAIGRNCDKQKVSIEEKIRVAHVPLDDLDPKTRYRVNLAQQLTGLHIMR